MASGESSNQQLIPAHHLDTLYRHTLQTSANNFNLFVLSSTWSVAGRRCGQSNFILGRHSGVIAMASVDFGETPLGSPSCRWKDMERYGLYQKYPKIHIFFFFTSQKAMLIQSAELDHILRIHWSLGTHPFLGENATQRAKCSVWHAVWPLQQYFSSCFHTLIRTRSICDWMTLKCPFEWWFAHVLIDTTQAMSPWKTWSKTLRFSGDDSDGAEMGIWGLFTMNWRRIMTYDILL